MTLQTHELNSLVPDLRDVPLDRLAELGDSVLAQSIDLYRRRLQEKDQPFSGFNSRI